MSRPELSGRMPSTNLGGAGAPRILSGKLGVVTGASRGIGAAICHNLASKGCSLVMNFTSDSSKEKADELANQLMTDYSVKCVTVQADVGSENGPEHIVAVAKNNFSHPKTGKLRIDVIVNNAGIADKAPIQSCDAQKFARLYNVNVRGPLFLIKAAIPYLPTDRSGRIVNVGSVSSSLGFPHDSIYGGTKAAVDAMTRTWSRELAENAVVNCVNPGPVATDMWTSSSRDFQEMMSSWLKHTPLAAVRPEADRNDLVESASWAGGRPGYESEIAGVVGMLCTPDVAYCTGSIICANGGMYFSS